MRGCENYCAYCVVPYVRGPELSRRPEDIISELESLSGRGVKEVVLLGQNVNSYGMKNGFGMDFPELLRKAAKVDGLERIRFTTNHPKDLSDRLIAAMAEEDKVCEQIHMPLQAGSDRVLGLMGRGYTGEQYLGLARKLRAAMPEVGIGTDLIVGFPGETEEDFERTLELCRELEFDEAFTFRYCSRPMTRAAGYADQVAEEVKLERLYRLEKLVSEITEQKNRASAGRVKEILVEGESRNDRERLTGRTREGRLAHIARAGHEHLKGELVWVKIDRGLKHSLLGEALEAGKGKESLQGEKPCSFR